MERIWFCSSLAILSVSLLTEAQVSNDTSSTTQATPTTPRFTTLSSLLLPTSTANSKNSSTNDTILTTTLKPSTSSAIPAESGTVPLPETTTITSSGQTTNETAAPRTKIAVEMGVSPSSSNDSSSSSTPTPLVPAPPRIVIPKNQLQQFKILDSGNETTTTTPMTTVSQPIRSTTIEIPENSSSSSTDSTNKSSKESSQNSATKSTPSVTSWKTPSETTTIVRESRTEAGLRDAPPMPMESSDPGVLPHSPDTPYFGGVIQHPMDEENPEVRPLIGGAGTVDDDDSAEEENNRPVPQGILAPVNGEQDIQHLGSPSSSSMSQIPPSKASIVNSASSLQSSSFPIVDEGVVGNSTTQNMTATGGEIRRQEFVEENNDINNGQLIFPRSIITPPDETPLTTSESGTTSSTTSSTPSASESSDTQQSTTEEPMETTTIKSENNENRIIAFFRNLFHPSSSSNETTTTVAPTTTTEAPSNTEKNNKERKRSAPSDNNENVLDEEESLGKETSEASENTNMKTLSEEDAKDQNNQNQSKAEAKILPDMEKRIPQPQIFNEAMSTISAAETQMSTTNGGMAAAVPPPTSTFLATNTHLTGPPQPLPAPPPLSSLANAPMASAISAASSADNIPQLQVLQQQSLNGASDVQTIRLPMGNNPQPTGGLQLSKLLILSRSKAPTLYDDDDGGDLDEIEKASRIVVANLFGL